MCVCVRVLDQCSFQILPHAGRGCIPMDRTCRPTLQNEAMAFAGQKPAAARWRGRKVLSCRYHVSAHAFAQCLLRTSPRSRLRAKQDRNRVPRLGLQFLMNSVCGWEVSAPVGEHALGALGHVWRSGCHAQDEGAPGTLGEGPRMRHPPVPWAAGHRESLSRGPAVASRKTRPCHSRALVCRE